MAPVAGTVVAPTGLEGASTAASAAVAATAGVARALAISAAFMSRGISRGGPLLGDDGAVAVVAVVVVVVAVDARPPPHAVLFFPPPATVVALGLTPAPLLPASIFLNMAKAAPTPDELAGGAAELPPGVVGGVGIADPAPACALVMARTEPGAMLTARLSGVALLVMCSGTVSSSGS